MTAELQQARKIILGITTFGLLIIYALNWNVDLVWNGHQHSGTVTSHTHSTNGSNTSGHYAISIEVEKNGETIPVHFKDFSRFFDKSNGDEVVVYESKNSPYRYYLPKLNLRITLYVFLFFVLIPLVFVVFGRPSSH